MSCTQQRQIDLFRHDPQLLIATRIIHHCPQNSKKSADNGFVLENHSDFVVAGPLRTRVRRHGHVYEKHVFAGRHLIGHPEFGVTREARDQRGLRVFGAHEWHLGETEGRCDETERGRVKKENRGRSES